MKSKEGKKKPRDMIALTMAFAGCWLVNFVGPFSLLIFPLLGFGLWCSWNIRSITALTLLLLLNPLGISFIHGLTEYVGGAPTLMYSGHARMRRWNVDRHSRAFRVGGSSMVTGNEWTWQVPNNTAIRLMCFAFGPPRKSYNGPFPSINEAISLTETGESISYTELLQGKFTLETGLVDLGTEFGPALIEQFQHLYFATLMADDAFYKTLIHCKLIEERCLLIRLIVESVNRSSEFEKDLDCLVFVDLEVSRPFAYWPLIGASNIGGPSFTYIPGMGRDRSTNYLHGEIEYTQDNF